MDGYQVMISFLSIRYSVLWVTLDGQLMSLRKKRTVSVLLCAFTCVCSPVCVGQLTDWVLVLWIRTGSVSCCSMSPVSPT